MALIVTDWCARAAYLSGIRLHRVSDEDAAIALASSSASRPAVDTFTSWSAFPSLEQRFRRAVNQGWGRCAREPLPVTVLVGRDEARRNGRAVRCRRWGAGLPHGALVRLDDPSKVPPGYGMFAPSPAFHWVLRSKDLDLGRTLLLGCELCGVYAMAPEGMVRDTAPLTSPDEIGELLATLPAGVRHVGTARTAAPFLFGGCASPREAAVALYASMPVRRGGFGLPRPRCNHPVALNARARALLPGKETIYLDLAWPERHVAVEYDSHLHDGLENLLGDKDRQVAADAMGFLVEPLTPNVVESQQRLDAFMERVAEKLGIPPRPLAASTLERRAKLRESLFTPRDIW